MSLMIWPIASGLSPSWEWLVTLRVSLMCFVTMFGVSRVPNTLHWMGSQRVLDEEGGPWLIYCPLFSLQLIVSGTILFLPSDSTPLTSEHNLNFQISDFWWYWPGSEQTNLPDVSSLQSGLVTAGGDAEMHGGSIIRGEGATVVRPALTIHFSSQWPHTFAFITSLSRHNTIGALHQEVTSDTQQYWNRYQILNSYMALFRSGILLRYSLWCLIHILFEQCSVDVSLANVDSRREIVMVYGWDWIYYDVCHDIVSLYSPHSPHN